MRQIVQIPHTNSHVNITVLSLEINDSSQVSVDSPYPSEYNAPTNAFKIKFGNQSEFAQRKSENITNDSKNIFNQYLCYKHKSKPKTKHSEFAEIAAAFETSFRLNMYQNVVNTMLKSVAMLSCIGFNSGAHEWSFQILECDTYRQEIGVISRNYIQNMKIDLNGIKTTESFGARAVYGCNYIRNSSYYASYNQDGSVRCFKDLSKCDNIQWKEGDIVKVCMNLDLGRVKFYVNGVKIRKTLSLERGHTYYPIISFCHKNGKCKYELLSFS